MFVVIFFVNVSADRLDSVSQILDKNAFYWKCAFDLRSLFDEARSMQELTWYF